MTNEKDKSRLREILLAHSEGSQLALALDDLLATVRGEEREAAWRDAMEIAKAEAFERRMAFNVYDALKAKLTENRKGEG